MYIPFDWSVPWKDLRLLNSLKGIGFTFYQVKWIWLLTIAFLSLSLSLKLLFLPNFRLRILLSSKHSLPYWKIGKGFTVLEICGWNSFRGSQRGSGIKYWMRFKEMRIDTASFGSGFDGGWIGARRVPRALDRSRTNVTYRGSPTPFSPPPIPFPTPNRQFADPSKAGRPRIARPDRE